jgi:hypothetical protein
MKAWGLGATVAVCTGQSRGDPKGSVKTPLTLNAPKPSSILAIVPSGTVTGVAFALNYESPVAVNSMS